MPTINPSFSSCSSSRHQAMSRFALTIFCLTFATTGAALAANKSSDAEMRYKADVAVCNSDQSYQDKSTCMKEAKAALAEARKMRNSDVDNSDKNAYMQNALIRCNEVPTPDRDACQRRIKGEGTISGDVLKGGVLRELVVPDAP